MLCKDSLARTKPVQLRCYTPVQCVCTWDGEIQFNLNFTIPSTYNRADAIQSYSGTLMTMPMKAHKRFPISD